MDFIKNDTPSMDNIYNSTYYKKTRDYEQTLANNSFEKSKSPFKTGVVPSPAYSSMFAQPTSQDNLNNLFMESLTGETIPISSFKHKNMQPFLRKGITQNTSDDNHSFNQKFGFTDYKTRKTEVENFFEPTTDTSFIKGMDNNTDFLLDRTNTPIIQNNYNPIKSIRVAPGLNQGYTSTGSGGFHQADSLIYAKPKDKEDLRPLSDQRSSIFQIPIQAPMKSVVDKRGVVEPFAKNKPETTYKQTEDNWFKGQSYLKKDTNRPVENLKDTSRIGTHTDYYGALKNQQEQINNQDDYGRNSVIVYNTNKHELTKIEVPVSNFSSVIKAITSPITDALKISYKEFFLNPAREFGSLAPQQPEKATTYDPVNHIMKTTIKETTLNEDDVGNLTGNKETYSALYDDARTTVKETMINEDDVGNLTGNKETYSALYDDARTTVKETMINEDDVGNLSGNKETYSALYDDARTTLKETNIHNEYSGNLKGVDGTYMKNNDKTKTTIKETLPKIDSQRNIKNITYKSTYVYDPSIVARTTLKQTTISGNANSYGFIGGIINQIIGGYLNKNVDAKNTQRQYSHVEYDGALKSTVTFVPMDREADMNAEIDGTREMLLIKSSRTANGSGNYKGIDKEDVNMNVNKQLDLYENISYENIPDKVYQMTPLSIDEEALTKTIDKQNAFKDRLDSSVLSSLIDNKDVIKINPII